MILLLFVIVCAWKFPSKHPKHWHLRFCWHGSFGLAKASKVCAATWHMIWNSTMAGNAGIDFLYPGDENQLFSMPKKTWLDLPTTTVADTFCWQPQIRKRWVAGISCVGLYPTDSPRELPWTLQQLQPTAATNSLAAETDITSYRVYERPRWVWNKRIHRMQKKTW